MGLEDRSSTVFFLLLQVDKLAGFTSKWTKPVVWLSSPNIKGPFPLFALLSLSSAFRFRTVLNGLRSMSEMRDPVIKLFGRSILLSERDPSGEPVHCFDSLPQVPGRPGNLLDDARKTEGGNSPAEKSYRQDIASNLDRDEVDGTSHQCDAEKNEEDANSGPEEGGQVSESAVGGGQEKALKKPDELLPCPRCNSLDTKFCYFNNYNVNQPRHFCKNCQRYWTAGGAMRNVPVGAGRRKNRLSSSHRQVVVTHNATILSPDEHILFAGFPNSVSPLKGNEEAPNLENGPLANAEEPSSSGGSLDASSMEENGFPQKQMEQVGLSGHDNGISRTNIFQPHPGFPWAYPWNSGWNTAVLGPSTSRYHDGHQTRPFPLMPVPMYFSPWINMQSMAAAASHWGHIASSDASSNSSISGYSSPSLGKHSREARLHSEGQTENCLWVPKTLRIHDPEEAAKSSIWNTLGIKPEKTNPLAGHVIFRSETESDTVSRTSSALDALQANPAALSRFQSFQEST